MHQKDELLTECIDLRTCAYFNWCEKFSKITVKFDIIPIPKDVVEYLKDEIIILPKECYKLDEEAEDEGNDTLNTPVCIIHIGIINFTIYNSPLFYFFQLKQRLATGISRIQ